MIVALDLGGTNTRIALFNDTAVSNYILHSRFKTRPCYQEQLSAIVTGLTNLDKSNIAGVGLAIGVQLTPDGQAVDASYTMPDYVGKAIVSDLSDRLECPVWAANDNVCGVMAEVRYGVFQGWDRVAYVTVSTGTGAGVYLRRGDQAVAYLAQIGHHIIDPIGKRCGCGQVGCLQTISGAQEIEKRYGREPADIENDLFWEDVAHNLAISLINLSRISRVEAVCLGGGIGFNNHYLRQVLPGKIQKVSPRLNVTLTRPVLGEDAPLIGAKILIQHQGETTIFH